MSETCYFDKRLLKQVATINDETLPETTDPDYLLHYVDIGNVDSLGAIHEITDYRFEDAPSRARRIVRDGDVIISTVRTYLQAIAPIVSPPENLIVSTGFAVVRPNPDKLDAAFCKYALREPNFLHEVTARSVGVSYPAINASELGNIPIPVPPRLKQRAIASFLDRETGKIDALIIRKQRLLEQLAERRQALISHLVTKGLNPDALTEDSGVEWFGDIPKHWEIRRLDRIATVKARLGWKGLKADEYVSEGYIFLSTPNIKGETIDFENVDYITEERYYESPEIMLQVGDILLAKDGATLGIVNVVRYLPAPATVNGSIAVIRILRELDPAFLYRFLSSRPMQKTMELFKGGMGVPHLFQADIRKFKVLVPPLNEQHAITNFLDKETARIDELSQKVRTAIELLQERRTALISEAVTGKFWVMD